MNDALDLQARHVAAHGSSYGMEAKVDDTTDIYVQDTLSSSYNLYHARFYFNPHSIIMVGGTTHYIFSGIDADSGREFMVTLGYSGSFYWVRVSIRADSGTFISTPTFTITDDWHAIEIAWKKSGAGLSNGYAKMFIDGAVQGEVNTIDNDGRTLSNVLLGAVGGLDATTSGTMYFDDFESRSNSIIGP